jgi:flavin-dependent dehydrogenase
MKTDKIVVVGGGSAGWMTAATLIKNFPNKKICVIESKDVPIVGVGESTLGQINEWLYTLGINEDDFMKDCDASLKLSIKFTDWGGKGTGAFHYPFGDPWAVGTKFGLNDWFIKKTMYPDTPTSDFVDCFYPAMPLVYQNKVIKNENNELPGFRYLSDVAYHFDATKFGAWLRDKFCIPRGVKHIVGTIKEEITTDDTGVQYLELTTGEKITADLYIDCTGWKSLLLKSLNVPFESYADILPNNAAWATRVPYTDKIKELEGYTNCTAIQNGWVWNIPLWSRIGTGYVFSDKYISKEDALEEFKDYLKNDREVRIPEEVVDKLEFKFISMRIGIHDELFHKNVCAIGLSAGFIEPLESNGLLSVHEFLHHLVKTLSRDNIAYLDKAGFNIACKAYFRSFAEFVSVHYLLNQREDTVYWKEAKERRFKTKHDPGEYMNFGFENLIYHRDVISSFENRMGGSICIAVGLNYFPISKANVLRAEYKTGKSLNFVNDAFDVWEANKDHWNKVAESAPTIYEFLKEKYGE